MLVGGIGVLVGGIGVTVGDSGIAVGVFMGIAVVVKIGMLVGMGVLVSFGIIVGLGGVDGIAVGVAVGSGAGLIISANPAQRQISKRGTMAKMIILRFLDCPLNHRITLWFPSSSPPPRHRTYRAYC